MNHPDTRSRHGSGRASAHASAHAPGRPAASDNASRPGLPRRWSAEGVVPFRLEVLTPVFIGSGEDLSPLDYVVRKEGSGHVLHLVDGAGWLRAEQGNSAVSAALNAGDLLRLRRLMDERLDAAVHGTARVPFALDTVAEGLLQKIRNPNSRSEAEVLPFARNPVTCTAFVPGSSLKGALSTPIIDRLDRSRAKLGKEPLRDAVRRDRNRGYPNAMEAMFGSITEHAMQALKVGDIAVPPGGTRISSAREMRLKPDKPGTPKLPCETLLPSAHGGMSLYGSLRLDCRSGGPAVELPGKEKLPWQAVVDLCNEFYTRRFDDEARKFYALPHFREAAKALQPVQQRIKALNPQTELLLRVGRYSHVECVTVKNNAPQAPKGFGKTRTLADGLLPFGWVILCFCSEEEYRAGLAAVEQAVEQERQTRDRERSACAAAAAADRERQRLKQEEAARAREKADAEKQRREQEAAAREAALSGLSPDERSVAELELPGVTEQQMTAVFARLDNLEPALQHRAALALKTCWTGMKDKWTGKPSKKQTIKIRRVKEILGE